MYYSGHLKAASGMVLPIRTYALRTLFVLQVIEKTAPGDLVHNLGMVHGATQYERSRSRTMLYYPSPSQPELAGLSDG